MRFQMDLPDEYAAMVDEIRENDPLKPVSRRQMYTKIVIEWLEANGYLQGNRKDKEGEKERRRRELQEEYRRKLAELEG